MSYTRHRGEHVHKTGTGGWDATSNRVLMHDGFEAFRHEVIQLLRNNLVGRVSEHAMHINSKGSLNIPIDMRLLLLPLVFIVSSFFGPLLMLFAGARLLCVHGRMAETDTDRTWLNLLKIFSIMCFSLAASLSPLAPMYLQIAAAERCSQLDGTHVLRAAVSPCPLQSLFDHNLVSGVEVLVPFVFPFFLGYWCTVHTFERIVAKQLIYQVAEEFDELELYRKTQELPTNGKHQFKAEWFRDFLRELNKSVELNGKGILGEDFESYDFVLVNDPTLSITTDGEQYAESWAGHITSHTTLRRDANFDANWCCVFSSRLLPAIYALIIALLPSIWMSRVHPDSYLRGGQFVNAARLNAFVNFVCLFVMMACTFHACVSRLRIFQNWRVRWHLILYLCSTDNSRRSAFRAGRMLLEHVGIRLKDSSIPFICIDPHLKGMAATESAWQPNFSQEQKEEATKTWHMLVEKMRHKRLVNVTAETFFGKDPPSESKEGLVDFIDQDSPVKRRSSSMIDALANGKFEFDSLDPMIFSYLRMWLKVGTTFASKRLEHMIPLVFIMTFSGLVLDEAAVFFWQYIVCSTIIVILVTIFFLPFLLCAIHHAVRMNLLLHELTVDMLLDWKELLRKFERQRFDQASRHEGSGHMTSAWLRLQSYFDGLFNQLDHVVEQVERADQPVTFLGVRLTMQWLTRTIAIVAGTTMVSLWNLVSKREHDFVDILLEQTGARNTTA